MEPMYLDLRTQSQDRIDESIRTSKLIFRLNHTEPFTDEYEKIVKDLFVNGVGENTRINAPIYINLANNIHLGKNISLMPYFKCMSAGQVYIEDNAQIAFNVSIITNDHDPYERAILKIKDVHIGKNAWIGAGATILSGVNVGENAIVGAGSVVTKDVAPNTVVVGNPARMIKTLDPQKFK